MPIKIMVIKAKRPNQMVFENWFLAIIKDRNKTIKSVIVM
jgi:hypothetical protein